MDRLTALESVFLRVKASGPAKYQLRMGSTSCFFSTISKAGLMTVMLNPLSYVLERGICTTKDS